MHKLTSCSKQFMLKGILTVWCIFCRRKYKCEKKAQVDMYAAIIMSIFHQRNYINEKKVQKLTCMQQTKYISAKLLTD